MDGSRLCKRGVRSPVTCNTNRLKIQFKFQLIKHMQILNKLFRYYLMHHRQTWRSAKEIKRNPMDRKLARNMSLFCANLDYATAAGFMVQLTRTMCGRALCL